MTSIIHFVTRIMMSVASPFRARPAPARATSRHAMRVSAESGSIRRQVLSRSDRAKLNLGDDRTFYASPRTVSYTHLRAHET